MFSGLPPPGALWLLLFIPDLFASGASPTRILFGSCNDARLEQSLWPHILSRKPDLWIWGGDNVYADRLEPLRLLRGEPPFRPADEEYLRSIYAQQLREPGYAQMLNSSVPIVGTWDDHDYGLNDGDKHFEGKRWSQAAFLDFLQEPHDSRRRSQEGVFTSKRMDFDGGSVLVILLDMRFHRDAYSTLDGDFFGEVQWKWLEQTLASSTARVHIFVSSLPLLPIVTANVGENWRRFPKARDRFLRLLTQRNTSAPVVLTGDVHFAQISMASCIGGLVLEVQSSGMTHSWGTRQPSTDNIIVSMISRIFMWLSQQIVPYRYQMRDPVTGSRQFELGLNFGELEIDWKGETLTVRIFGSHHQAPKLQQQFNLSELDNHASLQSALSPASSSPGCVPMLSRDATPLTEGLASLSAIVLSLLALLVPLCGMTRLLALLLGSRRKAKCA